MTAPRVLRARRDPSLAARVVDRRPLFYAAGADAAEDRPAHVRAGSALAWVGDRLAVVQDDASFVALVDPRTGVADAVALPSGPGGARQFDDRRGNKDSKLDLEACVSAVVGGTPSLVAFGSGSTAARDVAAVVPAPPSSAAPRVVRLPALYAALRARPDFSGSELNVEGAVLAGGKLRLFQRGNGQPREPLFPVDATVDLDWNAVHDLLCGSADRVPPLENVVSYDLGDLLGVRLTFTDAALASGSGDRLFYLAAAEDSPDAVRDGPVRGAALGILDGGEPRYAPLAEANGAPFTEKVEGVAVDAADGTVHIVLDADDPERPSDLCRVVLEGRWW